MIIRFGYVANALSLWNSSPSKTLTFSRYKQLGQAERMSKLLSVTKENLWNTVRALHFNIAHGIPLYRFSSSLVPLATHPEVMWDFVTPFRDEFAEIGKIVRRHKLRVSFHPSQFTLFTSEKNEVTENAVKDMMYHYAMLEAMGLEQEAVINIHVGGAYGDKTSAIERFYKNHLRLPIEVRSRMTLENDDKTYTTDEVLAICEKASLPLMFDYHHHLANEGDVPLDRLLPRIFATWEHIGLKPKVHLSSPKSEKEFRHHADHVDSHFIMPFLMMAKELGQDFDVMIEAKQKDLALLKLMEELGTKRGFKRVGGAIIGL